MPAGPAGEFTAWEVNLHGHRAIFRTAGLPTAGRLERGPVVLVHGMVNSSRHWREVALALGRNHYVIAPDLIGHGDSATPRGDYSLGAHACFIRDLLAALSIDRFTLVGHSLGGGVAMQFYYQFPERVERLALISSGGLGQEVSPLLRAAAFPLAGHLLALAASKPVVGALWAGGARLRRGDVELGVYFQAIARALGSLRQPGARQAHLQTLRGVVDSRGQKVCANDRLALLAGMPTLIVWGARDRTIPLAHGRALERAVPHSRLAVLEESAHFPQLEQPLALAQLLSRFIAETAPGYASDREWAALITGRALPRRLASAP